MDRPFDILVVGELNPDLILTGEDAPVFGQVERLVDAADLTLGSSAGIFACGAARLGLRVTFCGKVGNDLFGRFMLETLQERGVDISGVIVDPVLRTGLTVILASGGDRASLTYLGAIPSLRYDEIPPELLASARHVHLASYFMQTVLQPDVPRLFEQAHRLGLSTSLDTNYDPAEIWDGGLAQVLARTDIFLPNAVEARAIARTDDVEEALARLSRQAGMVAVKLGAQGAWAQRAHEQARVGSLAVTVADTVGAGDSFDAGFLYGMLQGWDLRRCLAFGAACGALSTRAVGGISAQPTHDEALRGAQRLDR